MTGRSERARFSRHTCLEFCTGWFRIPGGDRRFTSLCHDWVWQDRRRPLAVLSQCLLKFLDHSNVIGQPIEILQIQPS